MDHVNSFVIDWSIRFLENKDSIKGHIVNIEKNKGEFDYIINYNDRKKYFIVKLNLDEGIFKILKNDIFIGIFALNNPSNLSFIVSNWKQLIEFKFLNIYFVNPFSSSDKVWTINPYIHDKVCEKTALEDGLKAMAEMVNPLGLEELSNKIKLLKGESDR